MEIGRKDIFWNYLATFLKIASSALLLPFILRMMNSEIVGIWTIFSTITTLSVLLDFGFNMSFARNVTYVFSGVRNLKTNGHEEVNAENSIVDFGLLKGLIQSMRWFYSKMSIFVFLLLTTLGTYYIHQLLRTYNGNHTEIYIAWGLLCLINTYNLYTLYYDSLLQGKGLIKVSKQITIAGQSAYLIIASLLIISGFGLIAIVTAQAVSVIIIRILSYRTFFTTSVKLSLDNVTARPQNEILKAIYPNAMKIGLTSLGGFMVSRSAIIIGSLFLTLNQIATYGITIQLVSVISGLSIIYSSTYLPKIVNLRVEQRNQQIKAIYVKGQMFLLFTFILGGIVLILLCPFLLKLIGSKTQLLSNPLIFSTIIVSFLETNHGNAGNILLSKNEVPFFKASLLSGGLTVILLILFFEFTKLELWAMILAPGIAQGLYQNWKWPLEVVKDLNIRFIDFVGVFSDIALTKGNN